MESIVTKLKEYLAMDSEIEFSEFQDYYNKVLEKLNQDYQELTEDELLKIRYVLNTIAVNAENRWARKDKYVKKYKKWRIRPVSGLTLLPISSKRNWPIPMPSWKKRTRALMMN